MRVSKFIAALTAIALWLGGSALAGKTPAGKTTAKPASATAKKTSSTKKASSGKRGKSRSASRRAPRRPSQSAPTPDRYREIQQALADRGHYSGPVNGAWGPESVEALKRFQAEQKLTVDGKLNSLSLIALGLGPKRDPAGPIAATAPAPQPAVNH